MLNALTIDVEDYFQVNAFEQHVQRDEWDRYPLRVVENTLRILALLDEFHLKATFFVLGWVAERAPDLVREIVKKGHEVACHGYSHELVYNIGPKKFRRDVRKAKNILEHITGKNVLGYRAPSYSITEKSLWALDILVEEGFAYDSSIFPIVHDTYGIPGGKRFPHEIQTQAGKITEFPMSTFPFKIGPWSSQLPIAGGGYLRLFPAHVVELAIRYINKQEIQPAIVYFHPWEIDPDQPRIRAGFKSRFRHYLNLERMELKLRHLMKNFRFSSTEELLKIHSDNREASMGERLAIRANAT